MLVAADLGSVVGQIRDIFQLENGYRDPGVEFFGLQNMVIPIGDTFLEVVSRLRYSDTPAPGKAGLRRSTGPPYTGTPAFNIAKSLS